VGGTIAIMNIAGKMGTAKRVHVAKGISIIVLRANSRLAARKTGRPRPGRRSPAAGIHTAMLPVNARAISHQWLAFVARCTNPKTGFPANGDLITG